jgi:hypothetical protein
MSINKKSQHRVDPIGDKYASIAPLLDLMAFSRFSRPSSVSSTFDLTFVMTFFHSVIYLSDLALLVTS